MKTSRLPLLILSLLIMFASATAGEPSNNRKSNAINLFFIVADGLRYNDTFGNKNHLYTDNIWNKLRPLGTICTRFYNSGLTYPIPAQASLLTGVWHIFDNPLSDTIRPAFPTLFEYWKRKKSGELCYLAASKKNMDILAYSDFKEYGKTYAPVFDTSITSTTDTIYDKPASYIFQHHPSFVYLNAGSGSGDEYNAEECQIHDEKDDCEGADLLNAYYESIILTDMSVYDLWNRIQRDEIYKDKSVFIFLSTHGRHTDDFHGYGDNCRGCQQLNLLIIGPGIKKDFISKKKRTLIDICRTVGTLFDVPTPLAKGNVMKEILE